MAVQASIQSMQHVLPLYACSKPSPGQGGHWPACILMRPPLSKEHHMMSQCLSICQQVQGCLYSLHWSPEGLPSCRCLSIRSRAYKTENHLLIAGWSRKLARAAEQLWSSLGGQWPPFSTHRHPPDRLKRTPSYSGVSEEKLDWNMQAK